jgi:hypothetical protein
MAKYKFKIEEKFALWETYSHVCPWCDELITGSDLSIDHIIPESSLENRTQLHELKEEYGLSDDFEINDFNNWVPCHTKCNQKKSISVFRKSPAVIRFLHEAKKKGEAARKRANTIRKELIGTKIIGKLEEALERKYLTIEDVEEVISKAFILGEGMYLEVSDDWIVKSVDNEGIATVIRDGRTGQTPVKNPHNSWRCSRCGSYGPWQGNMCLSCGNMEDP